MILRSVKVCRVDLYQESTTIRLNAFRRFHRTPASWLVPGLRGFIHYGAQMMLEYPADRPQFFAMKFVRQLIKTAAGQDVGTLGFSLLCTIAATEDASGYCRPVTFYDSQLMMILGVEKQKQLATARSKAIACGWLQYQHGTKGVPGRYFVTIPSHANTDDDTASDEGVTITGNIYGTEKEQKRNESGTETERIGNGNGTKTEPFFPDPDPVPVPENAASPAATPQPDKVFLTFPVAGAPGSWNLMISQIDEWKTLYPGIDVEAECRKALAWIKANNRKTARGMPKFLVFWLGKATNDLRGNGNGKTNGNNRAHSRDFIQENPVASDDAAIFADVERRNAERVAAESAQ